MFDICLFCVTKISQLSDLKLHVANSSLSAVGKMPFSELFSVRFYIWRREAVVHYRALCQHLSWVVFVVYLHLVKQRKECISSCIY